MRPAPIIAVLTGLAVVVTSPAQVAAPDLFKPENRTTSSSRQFIVFGGTRQQRSDLARRAEELKAGVLRELEATDGWRAPVLIILSSPDGKRLRQAPVLLEVFDAEEAGRKIQLDIANSGSDDPAAVDAGILRAILLERALREQKFAGNRFVEPPSWIVAAMAAAEARKEDRDDTRLYEALLGSKGMPRLDRFLEQDGSNLRGKARELHAAQSLALYESLAGLPGGRANVVANLMLAEPAKDPLERFGQTWPDLVADPPKLARIWALGLARLAAPGKLQILSAKETSVQLNAALESLGSSESGEDPAQYVLQLGRTPEGRFLLEKAARDLQRLGFRAHPLYAALVAEYREMLDDLARKKRRRFAGKFAEAAELRVALDERSAAITGFLDQYQANDPGAGGATGIGRARPPAAEKRPRNDAIARYLDSVESRGW